MKKAFRILKDCLKEHGLRYIIGAIGLICPNFIMGYALSAVIRDLTSAVTVGSSEIAIPLVRYILIYLGITVLFIASNYSQKTLRYQTEHSMRVSAFSAIEHWPLPEREKQSEGELLTYFQQDISAVHNLFFDDLIMLSSYFLVIVGGLAVMFVWQWALALCSLVISILMVLFSRKFGNQRKEVTAARISLGAMVETCLLEIVNGIREIKSYCLQKVFGERLSAAIEELSRVQRKEKRLFAQGYMVGGFLKAIVWLSIPMLGLFLIKWQLTNVATVLAVAVFTNRYLWVYNNIPWSISALKGYQSNIERIYSLLYEGPSPIEERGGICDSTTDNIGRESGLVVESLSYQYPNGTMACKKLSIEAKRGEITVVTGPSGSGKSTLFKLLLGLYDPIEGDIRLDGISLYKDAKRRTFFTYLPQNGGILPGTIRENIMMGKQVDIEQIKAAAHATAIDSFIESLPEKYDTDISSDFLGMSGGQMQRIALARAYLENAPTLLLDEPTAMLDGENERWVLEHLKRQIADKICIIISHRPTIIEQADRVFLVEEGSIRVHGKCPEMLRRPEYIDFIRDAKCEVVI